MRVMSLAAALLCSAGVLPALADTPDDQLVVGFSMTNIMTLDPAAITGREAVQVLTNVYDGLVELDPVTRGQVNPDLAESWTVSDDKSSITFKLKPNATFASGNPVTAEAVVNSFRRLMSLNLAQASYLKTYGFTAENANESFLAPDDSTVIINLPLKVDPQIVIQTLGIVGPGSVIDMTLLAENEVNGDQGAAWLKSQSAGSGRFTFDGWRSNDMVILERNDDYWGSPTQLRRILMRHIPESQSQRLMIERGDLDIAFMLQRPDLEALADAEDVVVLTQRGPNFFYLGVSMADERFANPKVREALRYLIDYEGLNSAIMPYFGEMRQRPIQTGFRGALPDPGYRLDVERARQLLTEAGYPDGFTATLRSLSDLPFSNLAVALQQTLAQGGIRTEIVTGSGEQIYGAMRERNFELIVGRGGGGQIPHPDSNLRALVYNPDNSDEAKLVNFQGWRTSFYDADLNTMIETALIEPDAAAQTRMYEDIQLRLEEIVPAIQPFSEAVDTVAYRRDLVGFVLNPSSSTDLGIVSKDR